MNRDYTPDTLFNATVTGSDGDKIGKVDEVYLDNRSGDPEWISVKTGLFGSNVSLLPLAQATVSGDTVTVPFDKDMVKNAPHHDPGAELSETDETDLYRYSGMNDTSGSVGDTSDANTRTGEHATGEHASTDRESTLGTTGQTTGGTAGTTQEFTEGSGRGHDTSGPDTDNAMTRSKEELRVGTETREAGRARLRKYITTENVSRTVPVSHEEVVVTREPITEANRGAALSGGDLTEEEHEVVLTEERAVAEKDVVPVERVQVGTKTVESTETVQAELREERIDLDADSAVKTGTTGKHDPRD